MKVLVNTCYGGFGFSDEFCMHLEQQDISQDEWGYSRDNQDVVTAAEAFGLEAASGCYSRLAVFEVTDGLDYYVDEYDGMEGLEVFLAVSMNDLKTGLSDEQLKLAEIAGVIKIIKS
jgi:hypothetical protein